MKELCAVLVSVWLMREEKQILLKEMCRVLQYRLFNVTKIIIFLHISNMDHPFKNQIFVKI